MIDFNKMYIMACGLMVTVSKLPMNLAILPTHDGNAMSVHR